MYLFIFDINRIFAEIICFNKIFKSESFLDIFLLLISIILVSLILLLSLKFILGKVLSLFNFFLFLLLSSLL